ncbi:hypothetical protein BIW11_04628 [Tropilaelaps mercedesae]|uniref:Uncharacterized protein n=1 Tax=Tropilaelaps mercedesae TaxID=418985 RepID=A0A1V9X3V5_9ACAR|nr:hypothetical protein BIW11_04628 [Tropilaelaps mercedesae]
MLNFRLEYKGAPLDLREKLDDEVSRWRERVAIFI